MRILYFYQYFTTPAGSWSTRVYEFTSRWVQAGDSVTVVTSVYDKSDLRPTRLLSRVRIEGIDVIVINVRLSNKHGVARRLLTFGAYAALASWYALTLPADVVVASSGPITVALPALVARYLRRRPLVFEVRDLWPEGSIQLGIVRNPIVIAVARFVERSCYRGAARVICLSEGMAAWIRSRYGVEHIEVVPNPSDNGAAASASDLVTPDWAKGKKLVLYTGTVGLIDDCRQILDMAQVLREQAVRDVEVVVIGDGKERKALEAQANELGLDRVHFLGLLSKNAVRAWLKRADCALFVCKDVPFLSTASPNKVFDAFAAGVPVVQTTQGWIRDLFEREQCGLSVPPGDARRLAEAVMRVVSDSSLRARLSGNATRVARDLYDRDLLASRMRRTLGEAAATHA